MKGTTGFNLPSLSISYGQLSWPVFVGSHPGLSHRGALNLAQLLIDQGRPGEAQAALQQAVVMTGRQAAYDDLLPGPFK